MRATRLRHAPKAAIISETRRWSPLRRTLARLAAALFLLLAVPATASAVVPPSYTGMAPQGPTTESDYALMQTSGVKSVRLLMDWGEIEPRPPLESSPEFEGFDREVRLAAEHGIRVFPFVWGTPAWVAPEPVDQPIESLRQLGAWGAFLRRAVGRYGPEGSFWLSHPELDYLPIRSWEIWNEENIVTFSNTTSPAAYAKLLRESGRILHGADPGSQVILGGLFGRPLQIPPNTGSGDFLSRLYRTRNVKSYFDGVALHPYVADARAMQPQIENLRRVMQVHDDSTTKIYMTELGWGSDSFESRWERGLKGQARELNQAMKMLVTHRRSWRIGGVWWFSWADLNNSCQFCDSAGLLTAEREAKPSWYAFNFWTGGNPRTVPRASFGD